jgi:hypothetical protein
LFIQVNWKSPSRIIILIIISDANFETTLQHDLPIATKAEEEEEEDACFFLTSSSFKV